MVNIFLFEKELQLSWIPKILSYTDTLWYCLLVETVGNLNQLSHMGTEWCITLLKNVTLSGKAFLQYGLNLVVSNK